MEDNIQIFENPEFGSIRIIEQNGEPWFVARDVAELLGYTKPQNAVAMHVDEEDKTTALIQGSGSNYKSNAVLVNESGLYSLVLSSKLPGARKFKRWVTSEIIPTIRKHGAYMTPETLEAVILNPDSLLKIALRLKEETDKRKALEAKVEEDRPKLNYYNEILHCENAILVTAIAKDYGMSAAAFNKKLNELGIQYKHGGTWFLYDQYADQGCTRSETYKYTNGEGCDCANISTRWTQRGRLFLYEQLKAVGIVPVVEAA